MVIFLKSDVLFLLQAETTKRSATPYIKRQTTGFDSLPPVLSLLGLDLFVASRHFGFVACLSGRADLDGCVLERGGTDGHFGAALRNQ